MPESSRIRRDVLPIADITPVGLTTYDAKDPATSLPADRAAAATGGCAERARDPARRRRLRRVERIRRPDQDAELPSGSPPTGSSTTASTRPRSAHRRARRSSPGGTTTRSAWAGSPRSRPRRRATTRSGRTPARPLAETLKLNGYSTAQFGKCHEVPVWETSPMGPFSAWPTGSGFEHFYGFIGGETNQYAPAIYQDTVPVEPDRTPEEGYHFTEDMTDHAIDWISQQKALMSDKPFFVYYAPGATHAPHHVRPEWSDKYKGKFDDGWDALRERTFAKQKELGVIPPEAELTERPEEIPAWDDMPDDLKPVLARQMEVYAGFLEHTDHHVGRLIDALARARDPREHARLLHHRRQRRFGRGHADRLLQRARRPERRVRARDDGVHGLEDRRIRHAGRLQPLRGRLGARDGHAVPVDEAGRLALGRYAERHDRPLAERDQGEGRDPRAVPPRDRRRRDRARGGRPAGAAQRQRRAAAAARGRLDGVLVRRRGVRADRHTTQYFEMFCNRGIYHEGLDRGDAAQHPVGGNRDAARSTTMSGSSTGRTTGRRPTTWPPTSRRSSRSCSACS